MRSILLLGLLLGSCGGAPRPPVCYDDCGGHLPRRPMPQVDEGSLDVVLDIDQQREQGPKQYDKLFVAIKHDAPMSLADHPSGPLGTIDHVDVVGGTKVLATIPRAELHYTAEIYNELAYDRGSESGTREHVKIFLGPVVGDYVKSSHPFTLVLRGLTADGVLVIEKAFAGDEAGEYPAIVPPRPY